MSKNPYKNLANNSIAFAVANFGSKVISFVMVPFYTYVLSTEEYGTIDIMMTLNSLLLPVLFLSMSDAVLRYAMDKRFDKADVLSSAFQVYFVSALMLSAILPIVAKVKPEIKDYIILFGILFVCNGIMQILNQFLRASDHVKAFAINGVLYTLFFAGTNILFLVVFKLGINGYLLSTIVADAVCIIFAAIISKCWKFIHVFKSYKSTLKIMLSYSLPLIPNALMWWVMDASDKFVIVYYLGASANGIYAIAKKIPTLIDTFHGIFNQAWQISAIQENDAENVKSFTTKVYRLYFVFIFIVVSCLMVAARPVVTFILSESYSSSWKYIPLLLISVAFSSISGFLSSKLIANERTKEIFKTTIVGAVLNIAFNFMLIPSMGINGAAFATMVSFGVVWLIREHLLVKREQIKRIKEAYLLLIIGLETALYYISDIWLSEILMLLCTVIIIVVTRKAIYDFLKPVINKLIQKKTKGDKSGT